MPRVGRVNPGCWAPERLAPGNSFSEMHSFSFPFSFGSRCIKSDRSLALGKGNLPLTVKRSPVRLLPWGRSWILDFVLFSLSGHSKQSRHSSDSEKKNSPLMFAGSSKVGRVCPAPALCSVIIFPYFFLTFYIVVCLNAFKVCCWVQLIYRIMKFTGKHAGVGSNHSEWVHADPERQMSDLRMLALNLQMSVFQLDYP